MFDIDHDPEYTVRVPIIKRIVSERADHMTKIVMSAKIKDLLVDLMLDYSLAEDAKDEDRLRYLQGDISGIRRAANALGLKVDDITSQVWREVSSIRMERLQNEKRRAAL